MQQETPLLPVIQSIPHGGMAAPLEYQDQLALDATGIYNEADLWVDALYDFSRAAPPISTLASVHASIARGIVDVNRPPDDFINPDGAVKVTSSYGAPTYLPPLADSQKQDLIEAYWQPWHAALDEALKAHSGACRLLLDCHSMAQRGPTTYAFAGAARPFICLANLGDTNGEIRHTGLFAGKLSAPAWFLRKCGEIAHELFADMTLLEPESESPPVVSLNWPFAGGYISKRYTTLAQDEGIAPVNALAPWSIMVEVNRGLYVGNQNAQTAIAPANEARIADVRNRLAAWTQAICAFLPDA